MVLALMKHAIITMMLSLMTAFPVAVQAAPDGYSINSDSASADADSLYRIDLATGVHTRLGRVQSLGQTKIDVEGLAFAPDGTLYGVDDDSMTLFPINTDMGIVVNQQEVDISGMPFGGGNDFGLTFACDGNLYATSVSTRSLYRLDLNGTATRIGALGSLNANISALAAFGNPVKLFGLGNGLTGAGTVDSRTLYEIDPLTGVATAKPQQLGVAAAAYNQAGMAFDSNGTLWAITDRRAVPGGDFPSQILRIDTTTGAASLAAETTETGFESLAITVPRGCSTNSEPSARFVVQKRFIDGNNITPVTLELSCNTGLPLNQSLTVLPNEGVFGQFEVNFIVKSFDNEQLSCTVSEENVAGYTPTYTCLGESSCLAAQSSESCSFSQIKIGSENLCQVQNYPDPVPLTVHKEWLFTNGEPGGSDTTEIQLECQNVWDGDGDRNGDSMFWTWQVEGSTNQTAVVYPDFAGNTQCRATEHPVFSAVEADNGCAAWIPLGIGDSGKSCTIINTVFLEGIPTLSDYGLLLFAVLMLITGMVAIRRV